MCGIFVKIGRAKQSGKQFKLALNSIQHRGPDDEGFTVFRGKKYDVFGAEDTIVPSVENKSFEFLNFNSLDGDFTDLDSGEVVFGHRRLSIIEVNELGHQPMCYGEGRYWIVYNGELYNYLEIRKELAEVYGKQFLTNSDTEVVLAAYSVWGKEAVKRFDGMWSFVIYDIQEREVYCSRDRFGVKPLYYWISGEGNLFFASEIKQFTFLEGWNPEIDEARALDFLEHGYLDHTEFTLFEGVKQVRPGCEVLIKSDQIHGVFTYEFMDKLVGTWYSLEKTEIEENNKLASIRDAFVGSVSNQLMADVPVGITLSGGIDSSAIAGAIRTVREENLMTFTSCSEYKAFDERHWAEIVNKEIGAESHYIVSSLDDVIEHTRKLVWIQDEPYQSQSAMMNYLVYNKVKESGIKVILCGQGADEYMGGYGQWADMRFLRCNSVWSLLKQCKFRNLIRFVYLSCFQFSPVKRFINNRLTRNSRIFNFSKWNLQRRHILDQFDFNIWEVTGNIKHFMLHAALPKYLHWEDRNSMANSVEARVPFLNHRLVEIYSSLGEEDLLCADRKGVFKDAIKHLLPEEIYYRRDKKGFVNSEQLWVKEVDTEFFRTKLEIGLDRIGDRINKKWMLKDFDLMVLGKRPFDYQFWRIIIFGEWMSVFGIDFGKKK
ncbi:MAG: hypothetical protein RLZZ252_31 [Bacteroidota bacterium]|jgi:asparagine synthase (glutamine-hydrolysing)